MAARSWRLSHTATVTGSILASFESGAGWDRRFVATVDRLAELADEAHAEYVQGRTELLAPDRL